MKARSMRWALVAAVILAGTVGLALDGKHYWHDARFAFATTQFSFADVLDGRFNPHQSWDTIDERSSAGFYTSKVAHLWLLDKLYAAVPPDAGGLELAVGLSILSMLVAAGLAGLLVGAITGIRRLGWAGAAAFLLLPVTPYLAGKQLAEVTAILLTTGGLILLWRALRDGAYAAVLLGLAASAVLLLAAASRLDSLFGIAGFVAAAFVTAPRGIRRRRVVIVAGGVVAVVGIAYLVLVDAIGSRPAEYSYYLLAFLEAPNRPLAMSVLSVVIFAGALYAVAALAWFSPHRRIAAFFAVWLLIAWTPAIAITSAFMVEPRYLAQGLLPLAGLVALGVEPIGRRLHLSTARAPVFAGLVAVLVLPVNWLMIQLMPYELHRPSLFRSVDRIVTESPDAIILVPWAYTDFNFLRSVRPDAPIYSVNSPEGVDIVDELASNWHARYREWYDGRHVSEPESLLELMHERPVYYLGWHRYPPVEFVQRSATRLGLTSVAKALDRLDLLDHLETSWVASSPYVSLQPAGRVGMYEYFRMHAADTVGWVAERASDGPSIYPDGAARLVLDVALPPAEFDGSGGLIAADLTSDGRMDLLITRPGMVTAVADGDVLWSRATEIHLSTKAETNGLPGWSGSGIQAADVTGDGRTEVMYLARTGELVVLAGSSGEPLRRLRLPPPPEGGQWEHLAVANFRGLGDRDLLLQTTNRTGYRMGRYIAAAPLDGLLQADSLTFTWQRDDFLAVAHAPARLADLNGDGRDEVIGGSIVRGDGEKLFELTVDGHIDAIHAADVRPDLPGLEVVALEETRHYRPFPARYLRPFPRGHEISRKINDLAHALFGKGNRVFVFNTDGLIWEAHYRRREPQNAAVGELSTDRPGLEIWNRSRFNERQKPFVFDARGERIASYSLVETASAGWTSAGVEVIAPVDWTGGEQQFVAAKARHEAGPVAVFNAVTGQFVLRIQEQADHLYIVDLLDDWREEIVVMAGDRLRVYTNPAVNPSPDRPSLWNEPLYRRSKQNWNYYNT